MLVNAPSCAVEFRVRYSETDQMGIVYHANYLPWCEIARTELIRTMWKPYARMEQEDGVLLAVTEATLRYVAPARYDDLVRVTATLEQLRSRSVTFAYRVERIPEAGPPHRLVDARTVLTGVGPDGAIRTLPAELVSAFRTPAASR
jgi:acyl-CoA thioester hydrolase